MATCGTASLGLSGCGSRGKLRQDKDMAGLRMEGQGKAVGSGSVTEWYVKVWQCWAVMAGQCRFRNVLASRGWVSHGSHGKSR